MNLENLVPPLKLCKRIPEGAFADSALVWSRRASRFAPHEWVIPRGYAAEVSDIAPAPTLAEIMPECGNPFYMWNDGKGWEVFCPANLKVLRNYDPNPATAALKLWLELEGVNHDKIF